jgi:murein DD-endopeptidase MepM/ murein hydrolase activator NlpD
MRLIFLFLISTHFTFSQNEFPKDYFKSPLDIRIFLSGNFGELRGNHFHTGLDMKTNQKENLNVYASADGYVSRIKISTFGYGKAIYITHPNGFTTVYGHLNRANPTIEAYIKAKHYKEKAFEIEMFPEKDELLVKQGDFIALSGNTGGSGGPHLHFEIRDYKTEKVFNPMFFGFDEKIADTKTPHINALIVYPIDENSVANSSQKPILLNLSQQKDGSYIAQKVAAKGKIGFAINAYDGFDLTNNKNGLFKVETQLNGKTTFGYEFDGFGFNELRYINALLDYPRLVNTGSRFQKLFMTSTYGLSIIKSDESKGIIEVLPNLSYVYKIMISDFNKNKIEVNVPIAFSNEDPKITATIKTTPYFLKAKIDNNYKKENVAVFVPAHTFYDDFYLDFDVKDDVLYFQDETMAIHSNINISFEDTKSSQKEKEKMFIASVDQGKLSYNKTTLSGTIFSTYTKKLGKFILAKDTVAPKIVALNLVEAKNVDKQKDLQFKITDALSGIDTFNGYINGKWVLFEYDNKTAKIIHYLDEQFLVDGENTFQLVIKDNVGNISEYETCFYKTMPQKEE